MLALAWSSLGPVSEAALPRLVGTEFLTNYVHSVKGEKAGALYFDGVTANTRVWSQPTGYAVGTNDVTLGARIFVRAANPSKAEGVIALASSNSNTDVANAAYGFISTSGDLNFRLMAAGGSGHNRQASVTGFVASYGGQTVDICWVRSGPTFTVYIDGKSVNYTETTAGTPPASWAGSITSTYVIAGLHGATGYFTGRMEAVQVFNLALPNDGSEISSKAIMEHGVPYQLMYGNPVAFTSGTLVVGKRYEITDFETGDDFTNVGAASNATGEEFVATGTTPTTWSNGSDVTRLGAIIDLDFQNAYPTAELVARDRSSNGFDGTIVGGVTQTLPIKQLAPVNVRPPKGTASLPAYGFAGNWNTGIDSLAGDQLDFITGGSPRWSIDPSGSLLHSTGLEIRGDAPNGIYIGNGAGNPGNTPVITTAIGTSALGSVTSGFGNTAFGASVMSALTTGIRNTGVGANTLTDAIFNATGTSAFGYQVLSALETGNNNSAFGYLAGANLTTGANNVIVGQGSGGTVTTGSSNIYIGYNVDAAAAGDANTLTIGNLIFGTGVDGQGTTISTGTIGIGTRGPDRKLDVLDSSGAAQLRLTYTDSSAYTDLVTSSGGNLTITPSGGGVTTSGQFTAGGVIQNGSFSLSSGDITSTTGRVTLSNGTQTEIFHTGSGDLHIDTTAGGNVGIETATPGAKLDVNGGSGASAPILRVGAVDVNVDLYRDTFASRGVTTTVTPSVLTTIPLSDNYTTTVNFTVTARRTGGTAGTANDGGVYLRSVAANGVTALIGSVEEPVPDRENQTAWDVTVTHHDDAPDYLAINVTGAADNNISWHVVGDIQRVGN